MTSCGCFLSCEGYGTWESAAQTRLAEGGEALNEHVRGDPWPSVGQRREMLEAVGLIRLLHRDGQVSHHGEHYDAAQQPVPIYVSGFNPAYGVIDGDGSVVPGVIVSVLRNV